MHSFLKYSKLKVRALKLFQYIIYVFFVIKRFEVAADAYITEMVILTNTRRLSTIIKIMEHLLVATILEI